LDRDEHTILNEGDAIRARWWRHFVALRTTCRAAHIGKFGRAACQCAQRCKML